MNRSPWSRRSKHSCHKDCSILIQEPQVNNRRSSIINFGAGTTAVPKLWHRKHSCAKILLQGLMYDHIRHTGRLAVLNFWCRNYSCTKILVQEAQLRQNFAAGTHVWSYWTQMTTCCTKLLVQELQLYQNFGTGSTAAPKSWCSDSYMIILDTQGDLLY